MKISDIAGQAIQNLLRHRGRTLLTVLGVVVGCCSVVIMISIGIGMRLSTEATLAQMGDLNVITVEPASENGTNRLDESVVQRIETIGHVDTVIPRIIYDNGLTVYVGKGDRYRANYVYVIGEPLNLAEADGYELWEGIWDELENNDVLCGQFFAYALTDSKRPEGHDFIDRYEYYDWETDTFDNLPDAYVNILSTPITMVLSDDREQTNNRTISLELNVVGTMKENWNRGYETSEGILMDIHTLERFLDDYARITGSKKQSDSGYTEIRVIVDRITNVAEVEKEIKALGFRTTSMESIRKPMEQDVQQKQMLLGCVGAVSLFVAALGIANTMIMAITERIREIGVMKALGCFLKDIRKLFLLEAAYIGLIGGFIGIGLSYLISMIMNKAGAGALFSSEYEYLIESESMDISVIPWWLAIFAVVFSMLVGIFSGFYPAEKAVRISALEAIRHE